MSTAGLTPYIQTCKSMCEPDKHTPRCFALGITPTPPGTATNPTHSPLADHLCPPHCRPSLVHCLPLGSPFRRHSDQYPPPTHTQLTSPVTGMPLTSLSAAQSEPSQAWPTRPHGKPAGPGTSPTGPPAAPRWLPPAAGCWAPLALPLLLLLPDA